jgi:hypothetical protein
LAFRGQLIGPDYRSRCEATKSIGFVRSASALAALAVRVHIHSSGRLHGDPHQDDPQLVDLDAFTAEEKESAQADVALAQ